MRVLGTPGRPLGDVDLDPDDPAIDPVERGGLDGGEHRRTLGGDAHHLNESLMGSHYGSGCIGRRVRTAIPPVREASGAGATGGCCPTRRYAAATLAWPA